MINFSSGASPRAAESIFPRNTILTFLTAKISEYLNFMEPEQLTELQ